MGRCEGREGKGRKSREEKEETRPTKPKGDKWRKATVDAAARLAQPCHLRDVKALSFMCGWKRREVKCTPRQCEETPLHCFSTHAALHPGVTGQLERSSRCKRL